MPPWIAFTPPTDRPAFECRLRMFTPFTTICPLAGRVRRTWPCFPLSLPATTTTVSPGARSSQRRLGWGLFVNILAGYLLLVPGPKSRRVGGGFRAAAEMKPDDLGLAGPGSSPPGEHKRRGASE